MCEAVTSHGGAAGHQVATSPPRQLEMPALLILGFKRGNISLVSKIYRSEVIALSFVFVKNV